jgi:DNA-directed RNA polymerase delta subunit
MTDKIDVTPEGFDWKVGWYALDEDNRALAARLEAVEDERDACMDDLEDALDQRDQANAKLAQAVEALQAIEHGDDSPDGMQGDIARATLASLSPGGHP